jgi:hypothetical protein
MTIAILLIASLSAFSQQGKADLSALNAKFPPVTGSKHLSTSVPCSGFVNTPGADLLWRAMISPVPVRQATEQDETVLKIKADRLKEKLAASGIKSTAGENSTNGATPELGTNFVGNHCNGSSPLDNSVAISNGGIIISVTNTTIFYTNEQGQNLYYQDLLTFINDPQIGGICDPVVIYDFTKDRFVFFCQVSPLNSATSKLLIFFSKSNNPLDGWYYYKISGNPLNDGSAFDYPKLGFSNQELYITGNLFRDSNGQFNQAVIYQFTKGPAFSGGNLAFTVWYNISGSPFTICPAAPGQQFSYGPGSYFVATSSGDDNTVKLYDLTNDLSTGLAELKYYSIPTTAYKVAPDAPQKGTTVTLNTNDCRTLAAFYLNGYIHFVFNSVYTNNYCGLNYNRLNLNQGQNTSVVFGLDGMDYSFPSVSSSGVNQNDKAVLIGFQRVSTTEYPSIRVVGCDNDGAWSSSVEVKAGEGYAAYTGNPERWGDYSGTWRKFNSSTPTVWMSGAYGYSDNQWDTWIAQVFDHSNGVQPSGSAGPSLAVYPNPVVNIFSLEFSLDEEMALNVKIVDTEGRLVKDLFQGKGRAGKNVLTFNKSNLRPGVYFVILQSDKTILKNEKIIING